MTFLVPYSRDGFASIGMHRPYYRFSLAYRSVSAMAAIASPILLCFDLFGFEEHFFPWLKVYSNITR